MKRTIGIKKNKILKKEIAILTKLFDEIWSSWKRERTLITMRL